MPRHSLQRSQYQPAWSAVKVVTSRWFGFIPAAMARVIAFSSAGRPPSRGVSASAITTTPWLAAESWFTQSTSPSS
ncbi:MAG: hypothetical protein U0133_06175 [Gemmatimonadales bacterium]